MRLAVLALQFLVLFWPWAAVSAQDLWLEAVPQAERLDEPEGDPPYRKAWAGEQIVGYVFSSAQVAATTGYGGKPLDIVIGIDPGARITGVAILEEHEPILSTGRTREDLDQLVGQFAGRDLRDAAMLATDDDGGVDAVSGATITSLIMIDAIMSSARLMARKLGLLGLDGIDLDSFEPLDLASLVERGFITHRRITIGEASAALAAKGGQLFPPAMDAGDGQERLTDLYAALATPAMTGRNLLGSEFHDRWRTEHPAGSHAIWIGGDGRYSFKGTSWRRSGIFERVQIVQDGRAFVLEAAMHQSLPEDALAAGLREQALFTLPADSGFRGDLPFDVRLRITDHADDTRAVTFALPWVLPATLKLPEIVRIPVWQQAWLERKFEIVVLVFALMALTVMLVLEDVIARRPKLWQAMRLGFLLFTLIWMGGFSTAQLSVVNVLTFADALRGTFHWEQFLVAPLIFILWSFVAVTLLFWGRGVFCGWLCPFGALQELLWTAGRKLGLPKIEVPFALHERLRAIKFLIFLGLVAVSLGSMGMAYRLAEVEPFKTVIVLRFDHAWPFVAYALVILACSIAIQRFFCRYLCPLGAALALPARLKQFDWLKRRWQCGQRCRTCAVTCPVQAIQPSGDIHPGECIYCLRCQINYFDEKTCPVLIERQRRIDAREAAATKKRTDEWSAG